MKRSNTDFPISDVCFLELCSYIYDAWTQGWLDDFSNEHFLIRALENRLLDFVGKLQLIANNLNMHNVVQSDGSIDEERFCYNFCINLSQKLSYLSKIFGADSIKKFVIDQLSAGKTNYDEDTFFQALSEVSILHFYACRFKWEEAIYEPPLLQNGSNKNPEASFRGEIPAISSQGGNNVIVNIEVKSPKFPQYTESKERIMIPTVLINKESKATIEDFCKDNNIKYLDPRILKLRDFFKSAVEKFSVPSDDEFNILYINWSYRDFPSNSFLEAWSLLTNDINGILIYKDIAEKFDFPIELFDKITAVVVYSESLEGLMFSDFRYVWQRSKVDTHFRMWVINEKLRKSELSDSSDILFRITGMNPDPQLTQHLMLDYKSSNFEETLESAYIGTKLSNIIKDNALH